MDQRICYVSMLYYVGSHYLEHILVYILCKDHRDIQISKYKFRLNTLHLVHMVKDYTNLWVLVFQWLQDDKMKMDLPRILECMYILEHDFELCIQRRFHMTLYMGRDIFVECKHVD